MKTLSIGQLANLTTCKIPTIRFYEQSGLLPQASRTEGNQRRYKQQHVNRLKFILHARELGFSLDAIRELIVLADKDVHDHEADQIVSRQLRVVEEKIKRLDSLKTELTDMLRHCGDGTQRQCRVIDVLSDHALCSGEHGKY